LGEFGYTERLKDGRRRREGVMRKYRGRDGGPQNQAMVWVVVLLFAAGGGAVLYFASRSPRESPPATTTAGVRPAPSAALPPAAAAPDASAPASEPVSPAETLVPRGPISPTDPLPQGVEERFDEDIQRLRVWVKGIDLEEGVSDSWRMEASWLNPGRVRQRPTVINWLVIHKVPSGRTLKVDDFVDLRFDDIPVTITTPHYSWVSGAETCRWTTTVDDFLSLAGTKKVRLQIAAKEWTLSREALAILRTFAAVVPAR
jgi:hypothetical protein